MNLREFVQCFGYIFCSCVYDTNTHTYPWDISVSLKLYVYKMNGESENHVTSITSQNMDNLNRARL